MTLPIDPRDDEMSQQSPEKSLHQQAFSIDDTLKILNLTEKGVILFSKDYQVVLFNQIIEQYDPDIRGHQDPLNDFRLYSQKRKGLKFSLSNWFESCSQNVGDIHFSPQLWLKPPSAQFSIPVALQLNIIEFNQQPHLLLTLSDKTLERQQIAHQKLMAANFSGQFITNAGGYIAQPNDAFLALTGLNIQELSTLTYIDWLKKQVSFKVPFDHVMSTLINEHHWTGEVDIFSQSETQFKAILSISMLVDPHNNIEHFIGVLQDLTDIEHAHAEIKKLSYYDRLTGLANKTRLHDEIGEAIERSKTDSTFHSLLYIGLDGVKIINDTFGHRAGDDLLVQVAEKLQQRLNEQSTLARLDGSNFAVLFQSTTQERFFALQEITALANDLLQTVNGRYNLDRGSVHTSASIGSCLFPFEENTDYAADQMTSFADMAMYEAKKQGGNQVYLFETQLIEKAQKRLELIEALNHSELDEEFRIYFQPQVDKTGKTISAETLIRWFHPELGLVSPSKFIPVAEEGRQIIKIGLWVLHKAFLQIKTWNRILPDFRVAVNISPVQFHEQSFIEIIIGLVKFTHVNPKNITLELTEGVLIKNATLALQKIQHLVSLGFEISIDDFGTGYSSLSYLQKLPIHELKIDQSFIHHLRENPDDEAIVNSIIQLAKSKNLKLVAEGIETQQQATLLSAKDPDMRLQGYYFNKPIPADEFEKLYIQPLKEHSA